MRGTERQHQDPGALPWCRGAVRRGGKTEGTSPTPSQLVAHPHPHAPAPYTSRRQFTSSACFWEVLFFFLSFANNTHATSADGLFSVCAGVPTIPHATCVCFYSLFSVFLSTVSLLSIKEIACVSSIVCCCRESAFPSCLEPRGKNAEGGKTTKSAEPAMLCSHTSSVFAAAAKRIFFGWRNFDSVTHTLLVRQRRRRARPPSLLSQPPTPTKHTKKQRMPPPTPPCETAKKGGKGALPLRLSLTLIS